MIPMHFFSSYTLDRFLERISKGLGRRAGRGAIGRRFEAYVADKAEALVLPGRSF